MSFGYTCKYTPLELYEAFGISPSLLDEEARDFQDAETLTHANLCCHAKALLQQAPDYDELVLVDCCDSVRRSFDVLTAHGNHRYLEMVDLPHDDSQCARERFAAELSRLLRRYAEFTGKEPSRSAFIEAYRRRNDSALDVSAINKPFYAVLGARVSSALLQQIQQVMGQTVVNLTCSGNRALVPLPDDADAMNWDELMAFYAQALISQIPCMRMADVSGRRVLTEHPQLKGIIYNTVKFCDFYGFDYLTLQEKSSVPLLKIETDFMPQPEGQLSTRLEAFRESIEGKSMEPTPKQAPCALYAGIDSGSTTTNMVIVDENGTVRASTIVRTGAKAQNGARQALDNVCGDLGITPNDLAAIMATGYGRANIPFATDTTTEITCHAKGAHHLHPETHTIVDIGGQDSKVICLNDKGQVINFVMNDKCAAGTGRFLEAMARTLELDLPVMAEQGLNWKRDLKISSMCTVFAESEVISLIADNHAEADIIHGLNESIAARTASLVSRAKGKGPYMMTGGVARNLGVVKALEHRLGDEIYVATDPDLCGALGAALLARESA